MGETTYIGRFAPSPTGALHFGSLIAAVGSYLQARRAGGRWLIRMEDLDTPRVVPGAEARILEELARFGMESDGPVIRQSERGEAYLAALEALAGAGMLFPCACTRSELPPGPYPGTCRNGLPEGREGRSLRVRVSDAPLHFTDRLQGPQVENLAETCGDFVVRRADGFTAYQLAVVVDDAWQGITEIVRGADLLDSTARQRHLQQVLGLPHPQTLHLPIVLDKEGRKLGKRFGADPVERLPTLEALGAALDFLGHPTPAHGSLQERWDWALRHWDPSQIPAAAGGLSDPTTQALYLPDSDRDAE